jgi:predicted RNase H-like HicB family nuclease
MFDFLKSRTTLDDPEYQMVLEREEDGTFVATSPALPGYVAYGGSEAAAARKLRRAIRRNLEGVAADHVAASRKSRGRTSRHRSSLHFQLPLTGTAKIVLVSLALGAALALVTYQTRRRAD